MRQYFTKRRVGLLALLGPLAFGLWIGLGRDRAEAGIARPASPSPLPVAAAPVEWVDEYVTQHSYSGELRPGRAADLTFEAAGRVLRVLVDEGSRVEAGQVLAELEADRVRAELAGLSAARDAEAALLRELERGPRAQTIAAARAEVRGLEERLDLAELRRERRRGLVKQDAISTEELDVAVAEVEILQADLAAASSRLEELEEGTREEVIERQRALVAKLDASVARNEIELADRQLRAPFDAVVTRRDLDEGAVVEAGRSALRLIEADALEARIGVPVDRAASLVEGQAVRLEIRGRSLSGEVRARLSEVDSETRTADVIIALAPEDSAHHLSGEVVRLFLDERTPVQGAWIPTAALVPGARGLWAAYALIPLEEDSGTDRVERRELEVLYTHGDRSLVRGTLEEGDRLVVDGVHRVVPGQRVVEVR